MKFRNFKDSLSTLGGVYCAIEGWGILKCENANVLKAGINIADNRNRLIQYKEREKMKFKGIKDILLGGV